MKFRSVVIFCEHVFDIFELSSVAFGWAAETVRTEFVGVECLHTVVFSLWRKVFHVLGNQRGTDAAFWGPDDFDGFDQRADMDLVSLFCTYAA